MYLHNLNTQFNNKYMFNEIKEKKYLHAFYPKS